jgi:hypothetical protein
MDVTGYDATLGTQEGFKTVSGVIAYDDPMTGNSIMLVVHQAICIPTMNHNLLCPMQLRMNEIMVDECPKFLAPKPTAHTHAITIPDPEDQDPLVIALSLSGVTSGFPSHMPTAAEYKNCERRYDITYDLPDWEPHADLFAEQEMMTTDPQGRISESDYGPSRNSLLILSGMSSEVPMFIEQQVLADPEADLEISKAFQDNVQVLALKSTERQKEVDAHTLSRKWGIGLEAAKRTIKTTTQRGIRMLLHPSLSRQFRMNDQQLRYYRRRLK